MRSPLIAAAFLSFATVPVAHAATLTKSYAGPSFFDDWTFTNAPDTTTHGQALYVDRETAAANGLAYVNPAGQAIIAVDDTTWLPAGALRNSVRITSNARFNVGTLVIADLARTPFGCSTWPAFWMLGPHWPTTGEIDIFEGVHTQSSNQMTLHTSSGCSHDPTGAQTGTTLQESCDSSGGNNNGCGVYGKSPNSYGPSLASAGGGIFATQWTTAGISIWHWTRASLPGDVKNGNPDPSTWGSPAATWKSSTCDMSARFRDLALVFDITLEIPAMLLAEKLKLTSHQFAAIGQDRRTYGRTRGAQQGIQAALPSFPTLRTLSTPTSRSTASRSMQYSS